MTMRQLLANVWFAAVVGIALVAAVFLLDANWVPAVVSIGALGLAALVRTWWAPLVGGLVCAAFGVWAAAALLAVAASAKGVWIMALIRASDRPDPALLAGAVDRLTTRSAGGSHVEVLTTIHLLRTARENGRLKQRWQAMNLRGGGREGPLLDPPPRSGPTTLYAAEACKLAELAAERFDLSLDADLYAASATLVFGSDAHQAAGGDLRVFEEFTGAHPAQVLELLNDFSARHGGGDMARRLAREHRRRWLGPYS